MPYWQSEVTKVQLHPLFISKLVGGEWLPLIPGCFICGGSALGTHQIGSWLGLVVSLDLLGIRRTLATAGHWTLGCPAYSLVTIWTISFVLSVKHLVLTVKNCLSCIHYYNFGTVVCGMTIARLSLYSLEMIYYFDWRVLEFYCKGLIFCLKSCRGFV